MAHLNPTCYDEGYAAFLQNEIHADGTFGSEDLNHYEYGSSEYDDWKNGWEDASSDQADKMLEPEFED